MRPFSLLMVRFCCSGERCGRYTSRLSSLVHILQNAVAYGGPRRSKRILIMGSERCFMKTIKLLEIFWFVKLYQLFNST